MNKNIETNEFAMMTLHLMLSSPILRLFSTEESEINYAVWT